MQFPITIGLHRSSFLERAMVAAHGLAGATVLLGPWPLWLCLGAQLALLVSWWIGRKCLRPRLAAIRLHGDGRMEVQSVAAGAAFGPARLLPGATVHPWLTVFQVDQDGSRSSVLLAMDSLPRDDFRRLRVWLRWRADFTGVSDDA